MADDRRRSFPDRSPRVRSQSHGPQPAPCCAYEPAVVLPRVPRRLTTVGRRRLGPDAAIDVALRPSMSRSPKPARSRRLAIRLCSPGRAKSPRKEWRRPQSVHQRAARDPTGQRRRQLVPPGPQPSPMTTSMLPLVSVADRRSRCRHRTMLPWASTACPTGPLNTFGRPRMINHRYKEPLKGLWERFWSGGIANPLTAIEQISYLLFLRLLEVTSAPALDQADPRCHWSHIRTLRANARFDAVRDVAFPFLKSPGAGNGAFAAAMADAVFVIPTPALLSFAVDKIDELPLSGQAGDMAGDLYEYLLSELTIAGKNGQFRTPRHIVRTIVEIVAPQVGERICDPAAGTGGFLVGASQWTLRQHSSGVPELDDDTGLWTGLTGDQFTPDEREWFGSGQWLIGYDFDATMVRLAAMNLMLHGTIDPQIRQQDALALESTDTYDLVLANPPFTGRVEESTLTSELSALSTTKSELLFIERIIGMLNETGRAAVVLPDGALFGAGSAPTSVRKRLVEQGLVGAVISLPPGCFRPYSGVKTSVLLLHKGRRQDYVWFYEVKGDGFTLDDRRLPDPLNDDLRFVAEAWRHELSEAAGWSSPEAEVAAGRAWTVALDEISHRGFSLAASEYRAVEEAPTTTAGEVLELIEELAEQSRRINTHLGTLRQLLRERRSG